MNGIESGLFDIYDIGYHGANSFQDKLTVHGFDGSHDIFAGIFCETEGRLLLAVVFHQAVEKDSFRFMRALAPYAAMHMASLRSAHRQLELFIDYQKKIDFIKDSGVIFKTLNRNEALVNALNFFADAFHAEASCVMIPGEDYFASTGLTREDITELQIAGVPLDAFLNQHTDTRYITEDLYSEKFNVANVFLIQDTVSTAIFVLFNISGDVVPDRELSALITHLVSIAIENAVRLEEETQRKIEQAEMEQTVGIIDRFVRHEMEIDSAALQAYGVNYPARSTGGDYSTIEETDESLFICLADVCGKGFSAATLTVMLATVVDLGGEKRNDIGPLANSINQYLLDRNFSDRFITGFMAVYDKTGHKLRYVSCGHEPTMLLRNGEFSELRSKNLPMGIMETESYEVIEVDIQPGDLMFVY